MLVPSRAEKNEVWVRWDQSKKNMGNIKGLTVEEREFGWRMTQDMLKIGARKHWGDPLRRKECRVRWRDELGENQRCQQEEDRRHVFESCAYSRNKLVELKKIMERLIQTKVSTTSILHLDFFCANTEKLRAAIRLVLVSLRRVYLYREESGEGMEKKSPEPTQE